MSLIPDDGVGLHEYCTECHGKLFSMESREEGICRECAAIEDGDDGLDLEDRLAQCLKDDPL